MRNLHTLRFASAQLKRPDAVLFDWDDTLFNHAYFADELAAELLKQLPPLETVTPEELNRAWHQDKNAACRRYFGKTPDEVLKLWDGLYNQVPLSAFTLLPDVRDVLDTLKAKNIRLGIVSNKSREHVINELNHLGMTAYFDVVIGKHADRKKRKPNPAPIVEALQQMRLLLENIWFIGDSMEDMGAARACGIQRFHIHHSDERHAQVQTEADANDPAKRIISLRSIKELAPFIHNLPDRTAVIAP